MSLTLTHPFGRVRRCAASLVFLLFALMGLPTAVSATTTGEQKTAVILVNFQDDPSQPITVAAAHALVFGQVGDFYWEASYRKTLFSGDTYGWFTIPVSKTGCSRDLIAQEADNAATAAGVNLAAYARLVYLFPQNGCSASGYNSGTTTVPSRTWIKGNAFSAYVIAHELGHNFGLLHSQSLDCGPAVLGGDCAVQSYGDPADTMGYGAIPHFNAFQKELLGWLGAAGQPPVTKVVANGTYRIEPFATMGSGAKALKIAKGADPVTGAMTHYYLEYRQAVGFDAGLGGLGNLTTGVLVHTGVEGDGFSSYLLDMTPDSVAGSPYSDSEDGALAVGRTYVDSVAGVTVTVLSADNTGAEVEVRLDAAPAPPPACTRTAPLLGLSGPTAPVAAGSSVTYAVSLSNRDSGGCTATSYALARSLPDGWTGTLGATTLTVGPGNSASTSLTVTSAASAPAGTYPVAIGASSAVGSVHTASATATHSIAAALATSIGTDKTSYLRAETVTISARVLSGGSPVAGASVRFTLALPNGGSAQWTAATGTDGFARTSYRLGKGKTAIGSYTLRADASSGGAIGSATTGFSVR